MPRDPDDGDLESALLEVDVRNVAMFVDVRNFPDPEAGSKGLTRHNGNHPNIINGIVRHPRFSATLALVKEWWVRTMAKPDGNSDVALAFYCKSGRHRSVAWACILHHILNSGLIAGSVDVIHQSFRDGHWRYLCSTECPHCFQQSDMRDEAFDLAMSTWYTV